MIRSRRTRRWLLGLEVAWFVAVLAAVTVGDVAYPFPPGSPRGMWVAMVVVGTTCLLAALARWWIPERSGTLALAVLGVEILVDTTFPAGSIGPLRLLCTAAAVPVLITASVRRSSMPVAVLVIVAGAVSATADVIRRGNTLSTDIARQALHAAPSPPFTISVAALLLLVPTAIGLLLRYTDAARRVESLARVRAEERLQLSRELHDMVARHVTGIIVTAQAAALDEALPASTRRTLGAIEEAGNDALDAMGRMVGALRTVPEPHDGVDRSLGSWDPAPAATTPLDAVRTAIGDNAVVTLRVGEDLTGDGEAEVSEDVVTTLHRIVVEALTNVRRYTPAGSPVTVDLSAPRPSVLVLEILSERGHGAGRPLGSGHGLVGLAERAAAVGGRLEAGPTGEHWRVRAELPRGSERQAFGGSSTGASRSTESPG